MIHDNYIETVRLPLILHNRDNLMENLEATKEIIRNFLAFLVEKGVVKKFGYNISFPIEDTEVRISIFGEIDKIIKWLDNKISDPKIEKKDFFDWVDNITSYLEKNYSKNGLHSDIFTKINSSGIL